jgi:hypothetical protein
MTYRIHASNGRESRVVAFAAIGNVCKTEFGDRDVCEAQAAWLRATNPKWESEVEPCHRTSTANGIANSTQSEPA